MAFRSYRETTAYPGFFIGEDKKSTNQSSAASGATRAYVGGDVGEK